MSNLQHWQQKIQEHRKQTPWRDFVMEICSWYNVGMYKTSLGVAQLPENERSSITIFSNYEQEKENYLNYGFEFSSSTNFFDQIISLRHLCKLPHILRWGPTENSLFAGTIGYSKNIYLSFEVFACENVLYSINVKDSSTNILNSIMVGGGSSNVYQSLGIFNSMNVFFSRAITDSNNILFSENLLNCEECVGCNNLEYKKYFIFNKEYSKDEYFIEKEIILSNKESYTELISKLEGPLDNLGSESTSGSLAIKCLNSHNVKLSYRLIDSQNTVFVGTEQGNSNMYDVSSAGAPYGNHYYGVLGAGRGDHYYCSYSIEGCNNMYYSFFCIECSFCLGCVGLFNKSYCILNKQYTKEERYEKVDEIFAQMDADGTLGQFFPASMNPFYFNDTAAYLIDPSFTKEEVIAKGYLWRDEPIKVDIPAGAEVVKTEELGQYEGWMVGTDLHPSSEYVGSIADVKNYVPTRYINPSIKNKIIQDDQGNVYRIIPMEYDFLMKYGLPLPRKHWLDRMRENFKIG